MIGKKMKVAAPKQSPATPQRTHLLANHVLATLSR
jgi:hypothetical protein